MPDPSPSSPLTPGRVGAGAPSRSQRIGWVLLAWLAGIGAVPFASAGSLAVSEALGVPDALPGSIGLALVGALVAWVAGRPGTSPATQVAAGAAFGPAVVLMTMLVFRVTFPVPALLLQTLSTAAGATTYVVLSQRRARLTGR